MLISKKKYMNYEKGTDQKWPVIVIFMLIVGLMGSAIGQEGQIIKEIKIENQEYPLASYKFPEPILLYPGNEIRFHCVVIPTVNLEIKNAYLNITRVSDGKKLAPVSLNVSSNKTIDDTYTWILSEEDKVGIYVASIDIVTTDNSIPDAGAYVSLKLSPAGIPIIIKFEDLNGNNKFDGGAERTLSGWDFEIVDSKNKKLTNTTDRTGTIRLNATAVDDIYTITEDPAHKALYWQSTPPKEVKNGVYKVLEGERELYYANRMKDASLLIIKFEDRNGNLEYDSGEGLANRDFTVESISGPKFAETVRTNSSGIAYVSNIPFESITGLPDDYPAQEYSITESRRSGWAVISSMVKDLHPGEDGSIFIQNVLLNGVINIRKYEDINGNKKYDSGEGCSGWVFTLTGVNTNLRSVTNDSGFAKFDVGFLSDPKKPDELPRNTYVLHEEPKDGWVKVKDQNIVLSPNEEKTVDVANNPEPGTITVRKYEDANRNGRGDAGEERAGWTFTVSGPGVRTPAATTNANGIATFTVDFTSDPGNPCQPSSRAFTVHEVPKGCFEKLSDQQIELGSGEEETVTFLNRMPDAVLEIQKFYDANKNGVKDAGEDDGSLYPLDNWKFDVTFQGTTKQYSTNANGKIEITMPGVQPEAICTVTESLTDRPGWICTTTNPRTVKISCTESYQLAEFGNRVNHLVVTKFNDTNLNGKRDAGEEGLSGWTFNFKDEDGKMVASKATDADGIITLEGLSPGKYQVTEVLQKGWINTTPLTVTVDVKNGEDVAVPAFGNVKSSRIEIFKFNDTNRNGKRDADESGLPGITFKVKTPDGKVIAVGPTNADGIISLDGLTRGIYSIIEDVPDGWLNTTPSSVSVRLGLGESKQKSFGNYYCLRCRRINDQTFPGISRDSEITVTKKVSNISTQKIDRDNGYVIDYNITLCPNRGIDEVDTVPTDIVIAVDNSPSILRLNKSAIQGVQKLAMDIAANDERNVTRIGLVSWSDKDHSSIEMPLINDYASIIDRASNLTFAKGNQTNYQIGMDTAIRSFESSGIIIGRDKKIVIITDASDNGTLMLKDVEDARYSGYTIFAIVVGNKKETNTSRMLDALTQKHQGYVISMKDLSGLEAALVTMVTSGSKMEDVHLVEVLPSYLVLINSTATDDMGAVSMNREGTYWSTTTISWDIGELSSCWTTNFQAAFCWKLPADVNQRARISYVNYTDEKGQKKTLNLPEYEINIVPATENAVPMAQSEGGTENASGFEALFATIGLSMAGYLCHRRLN